MKLDFNEVERPTLDIVLRDNTELHLTTPTKADEERFLRIFKCIQKRDEKTSLDDVYECCANLLSYNTENKEINKAQVKGMFNIDDVILLLKTYTEFILGLYNLKN